MQRAASVSRSTRTRMTGLRFPSSGRTPAGEFGNAIRGPLGIHRANQVRYCSRMPPTLDAQLGSFAMSNGSLGKNSTHSPRECPPSGCGHSQTFCRSVCSWGQGRGFRILSYVRPVRRSGRNYVAQCPSCAQRGEDRHETHLSISVAEPRMYRCWAGCTKE